MSIQKSTIIVINFLKNTLKKFDIIKIVYYNSAYKENNALIWYGCFPITVMKDKKLLEDITNTQSSEKIYKSENNIYIIRREFAVGGSSILEQTVSMLLDEMEKRERDK